MPIAPIYCVGILISVALMVAMRRFAYDQFPFTYLFSIPWALGLVGALCWESEDERLEAKAVAVLFCAWWLFIIGALGALSHRRPSCPAPIGDRMNRVPTMVVLSLLVAAHVLAWIYEFYDISSLVHLRFGDIAAEMARNRNSGDVYVKLPWFINLARFAFIYYIPLAMIAHKRKWLSASVLVACLSGAALLVLVRFTRAPLAAVGVTILVSWNVLYRPSLKRLSLFAGGACSLLLATFLLMQITLVNARPDADPKPLAKIMAPYTTEPFYAYQWMLNGNYPKAARGYYVGDSVNWFLNTLGFIDEYPELIRLDYNSEVNTYTFLDAFTLDFGLAGALLGALATGYCVGLVYKGLMRTGGFMWFVLYLLCCYFCVMAVLNNEFIRNTLIIVAVCAKSVEVLCTKGSPRRRSRRTVVESARGQMPPGRLAHSALAMEAAVPRGHFALQSQLD